MEVWEREMGRTEKETKVEKGRTADGEAYDQLISRPIREAEG